MEGERGRVVVIIEVKGGNQVSDQGCVQEGGAWRCVIWREGEGEVCEIIKTREVCDLQRKKQGNVFIREKK